MEPTRSTTNALTADMQRAINVLPPAHRSQPQNGELVDNPQDGYAHLQDWAFVQGFTLVKEVVDLSDGCYTVFITMIKQKIVVRQSKSSERKIGYRCCGGLDT